MKFTQSRMQIILPEVTACMLCVQQIFEGASSSDSDVNIRKQLDFVFDVL
jgi:hypothetical protein